MNKWSKSLPSIIELTDDATFNIDPFFKQKQLSSPTDDTDSLTDVSMIIQTKPTAMNFNQPSTYYTDATNEYKPAIEIDNATHNQFIPTGELFQSLVDYANSFSFDQTTYSPQNLKKQLASNISLKQKTQPSDGIEKHKLTRHKSCGDLTFHSKPTPTTKQDPTKLVRSHLFSTKKTQREDNDKHSDESTTVTDGSKFQWEYVSDQIDYSQKPSNERSNNYQLTTKIGQINSQNFEQLSPQAFTQKLPPSSIIIREKAQDLYIQQNIDIQFVRPSTPPLPRTPIIIREVLRKPSFANQSNLQRRLPRSSSVAAFTEHDQTTKPPVNVRKPPMQPKHHTPQQPRKIIIEYDQVNVTLAKNINQRKDIKRTQPNQYLQQHGSSLYPNNAFHQLLTNITS